MADSSFDIVSKVDRQEADNALNQAAKELATRFDFKNTGTTIECHPLPIHFLHLNHAASGGDGDHGVLLGGVRQREPIGVGVWIVQVHVADLNRHTGLAQGLR